MGAGSWGQCTDRFGKLIWLSLLILEPLKYSDHELEFFLVQVKQTWFQWPLFRLAGPNQVLAL